MKGRRDLDKEKEPCPTLLDPYSSSPRQSSLSANTSSLSSSSDSNGWQKPSKVAHWSLSGSSTRDQSGNGGSFALAFGALVPLGDSMDLGFVEEAGP